MVLARVAKPKVTAHDQKRHGRHHKASGHYTKTYWPYLPMLAIVVAGFILNTTWNTSRAVLGYATAVSPTTLLQESNIQRSQHGKGALTLNSKLSAAAQAKANDMVTKNYWSHVAPDGVQPWQFISNAGYVYASAAENLAYGFDSSSAAVTGWMNSEGHRLNLLNMTYTEVGFGIANSNDFQNDGEQTIIVAMYGQPQAVVTPTSVQNGTAPQVSARVSEPQPAPALEQSFHEDSGDTPAVAAVSDTTHNGAGTVGLQARQVSRIDVLTNGNAQWAGTVVALLAGMAAMVFIYRHGKAWKKLIVRGEQFIIHHPVLDIAFVFVFVAGFVLTRTTGIIH